MRNNRLKQSSLPLVFFYLLLQVVGGGVVWAETCPDHQNHDIEMVSNDNRPMGQLDPNKNPSLESPQSSIWASSGTTVLLVLGLYYWYTIWAKKNVAVGQSQTPSQARAKKNARTNRSGSSWKKVKGIQHTDHVTSSNRSALPGNQKCRDNGRRIVLTSLSDTHSIQRLHAKRQQFPSGSTSTEGYLSCPALSNAETVEFA